MKIEWIERKNRWIWPKKREKRDGSVFIGFSGLCECRLKWACVCSFTVDRWRDVFVDRQMLCFPKITFFILNILKLEMGCLPFSAYFKYRELPFLIMTYKKSVWSTWRLHNRNAEEDMVYKLKKPIYELKQTLRNII